MLLDLKKNGSGLQGGNLVLRRSGGALLEFALDMFGKVSPACDP
jgi:hypothetical protein